MLIQHYHILTLIKGKKLNWSVKASKKDKIIGRLSFKNIVLTNSNLLTEGPLIIFHKIENKIHVVWMMVMALREIFLNNKVPYD